MAARPATPPTTPPAIAAVFDCGSDALVICVGAGRTPEEGVCEADAAVEGDGNDRDDENDEAEAGADEDDATKVLGSTPQLAQLSLFPNISVKTHQHPP